MRTRVLIHSLLVSSMLLVSSASAEDPSGRPPAGGNDASGISAGDSLIQLGATKSVSVLRARGADYLVHCISLRTGDVLIHTRTDTGDMAVLVEEGNVIFPLLVGGMDSGQRQRKILGTIKDERRMYLVSGDFFYNPIYCLPNVCPVSPSAGDKFLSLTLHAFDLKDGERLGSWDLKPRFEEDEKLGLSPARVAARVGDRLRLIEGGVAFGISTIIWRDGEPKFESDALSGPKSRNSSGNTDVRGESAHEKRR